VSGGKPTQKLTFLFPDIRGSVPVGTSETRSCNAPPQSRISGRDVGGGRVEPGAARPDRVPGAVEALVTSVAFPQVRAFRSSQLLPRSLSDAATPIARHAPT